MPPKKRSFLTPSDVQTARGRLKGALQDVVSVHDTDEDDSMPLRGRPPKPKRLKQHPQPIHQAFIMKLFDRSVDLAKYNEHTALYPICRAWMINQPRSVKIPNLNQLKPHVPYQREKMPNVIDDIKSGRLVDIDVMPACNTEADITRIPSPLPFQKEISSDNIDIDYDLDKPKISREKLLAELKQNCVQVKKKWQTHTKKYSEAKYGLNLNILETIYKA